MVSLRSCAWLSVLKPVSCQHPDLIPCRDTSLRTFVTVDESILDYHRPAICGCKLLRLPPRLPETTRVLDMIVWSHSTRYAQHMACKEVFGAAKVDVRGV
jgi:hypothetical protein